MHTITSSPHDAMSKLKLEVSKNAQSSEDGSTDISPNQDMLAMKDLPGRSGTSKDNPIDKMAESSNSSSTSDIEHEAEEDMMGSDQPLGLKAELMENTSL